MQRVFLAKLLVTVVALGAIPEIAAAQLEESVDLESIGPGERFLQSSAIVTRTGDSAVLFYDFATRCTVVSDEGQSRYYPASDQIERDGAAAVALRAWDDITAVSAGASLEDPHCEERMLDWYSTQFETDAERFGAITRHAISVLRGAPLDGSRSTLNAKARSITERSRDRIGEAIVNPILLSSVHSQSGVILVIGDPFSPYRWLAEYSALPGGTWQFEGGYDAGIL